MIPLNEKLSSKKRLRGSHLIRRMCVVVVACVVCFPAVANERRIVSLSPATTEWVVALGLQSSLKGVTEQCDMPPSVRSLQKVGSFMRMSLERVLALHPTDVVVVDGFPEAQRRLLTSSGASVHVFGPQRLKDFPDQILAMGKALGAPEAAGRLSSEFQNQLRRAEGQRDAAVQRALFFVSSEPVYLVGSASWLSDIFLLGGFENALNPTRSGELYPRVSPESLLGLSGRHWFGFYEEENQKLAAKEKMNLLSSRWSAKGKQRAFVEVLPASLFLRPGPRLWEALGALRKIRK
ncbi:MAG: hypothetical protein RIR26_2028 [Pseudomonadota bacterium]